jgi:diguanylate cyclase (GGDEF)-like protein
MEVLVAAIIYIAAGFLGFALCTFGRFRLLVFYYSFFSVAIGVWSLAVSPARSLVFNGSWREVELVAFYVMPIPLSLYFDRMFNGGFRNLLHRIAQGYTLVLAAAFTYVLFWSHSLESVLPLFQVSLLVAILIWMATIVPTIRNNKENVTIVLGGFVMGLTGALDIVHALRYPAREVHVVHIGILCFFLAVSAQFVVALMELKQKETMLARIAAGTTGTGEDFFHSFVRELVSMFNARSVLVGRFVNGDGREIETVAVWADGGLAENFRFDANDMFNGLPKSLSGARHHFGIPLLDKNAESIGVIRVLHDDPTSPGEVNRTILEIFAARASAEIQRHDAEAEISFLGQHDALTGLPNRALFTDRLHQAIAFAEAHSSSFALLFLDIDHFKKINDSLGHQRGDAFLRKIGELLKASVKPIDTVSRRGGDEFIILLPEDTPPEEAASLAQSICEKIAKPFEIDGFRIGATASIGVAVYPRDGKTAETLIKNADIAMYYAKESGRNQFQYFSDELNRVTHERIEIDVALRDAIRNNELEVHYQPQLNFKNGKIESCEALLRWNHPSRGQIAPGKFIPIAEESGQIIEIGRWVLDQVARDFTELKKAGYPDLRVSVNASARQIQSQDFAASVEEVILRHGLTPNRLELEVTESMIMQDTQKSRKAIRQLSEIGVKFSIDDFGTGYSSLSYLRQLKIHYLKIDQSFVRDVEDDPDDAAIVRTIIGLAHNLRLSVVAEGVETKEQRQFLKTQGCDMMQGYLLAKPMPFQELVLFLGNFR